MPDSVASNLFKEYTVPGAATLLQGLPDTNPKTFETTWCEFKSGYVKDPDFNRIWSEIIGAFANTEGGVIVWGIYANTVPGSRIDAAETMHYVENAEEFTTRLKKAAKDMVSPPIKVNVQPVLLGDGSKKGFVVCYVPEGIDKPYESLKADFPYYGRFDDRCEKLPRSFLRQLFHPSIASRVDIYVTAERPVDFTQRDGSQKLIIRLFNHGPHSIEYGFVVIKAEYVKMGIQNHIQPTAPQLQFNLPQLLHPECEHEMTIYCIGKYLAGGFTVSLYQSDQAPRHTCFELDFQRRALFVQPREYLPQPAKFSLVAEFEQPLQHIVDKDDR